MVKTSVLIEKANIAIFKFFNKASFDGALDDFMILIDILGDPHRITFHILLIFLSIFFILFLKKNNKGAFNQTLITSIASITTFLFSLSSLALALIFKEYTSVSRPFCSLDMINTIPTIIEHLTCKHSFPSGHIVLSCVITTSFWPMLNKSFKIASLIFIALTAITRMASGAHYPIDLLGGAAISLPLTLYTRVLVNKYLIGNRHIKTLLKQ